MSAIRQERVKPPKVSKHRQDYVYQSKRGLAPLSFPHQVITTYKPAVEGGLMQINMNTTDSAIGALDALHDSRRLQSTDINDLYSGISSRGNGATNPVQVQEGYSNGNGYGSGYGRGNGNGNSYGNGISNGNGSMGDRPADRGRMGGGTGGGMGMGIGMHMGISSEDVDGTDSIGMGTDMGMGNLSTDGMGVYEGFGGSRGSGGTGGSSDRGGAYLEGGSSSSSLGSAPPSQSLQPSSIPTTTHLHTPSSAPPAPAPAATSASLHREGREVGQGRGEEGRQLRNDTLDWLLESVLEQQGGGGGDGSGGELEQASLEQGSGPGVEMLLAIVDRGMGHRIPDFDSSAWGWEGTKQAPSNQKQSSKMRQQSDSFSLARGNALALVDEEGQGWQGRTPPQSPQSEAMGFMLATASATANASIGGFSGGFSGGVSEGFSGGVSEGFSGGGSEEGYEESFESADELSFESVVFAPKRLLVRANTEGIKTGAKPRKHSTNLSEMRMETLGHLSDPSQYRIMEGVDFSLLAFDGRKLQRAHSMDPIIPDRTSKPQPRSHNTRTSTKPKTRIHRNKLDSGSDRMGFSFSMSTVSGEEVEEDGVYEATPEVTPREGEGRPERTPSAKLGRRQAMEAFLEQQGIVDVEEEEERGLFSGKRKHRRASFDMVSGSTTTHAKGKGSSKYFSYLKFYDTSKKRKPKQTKEEELAAAVMRNRAAEMTVPDPFASVRIDPFASVRIASAKRESELQGNSSLDGGDSGGDVHRPSTFPTSIWDTIPNFSRRVPAPFLSSPLPSSRTETPHYNSNNSRGGSRGLAGGPKHGKPSAPPHTSGGGGRGGAGDYYVGDGYEGVQVVGLTKFVFRGPFLTSPFLHHMTIDRHKEKYGDSQRAEKAKEKAKAKAKEERERVREMERVWEQDSKQGQAPASMDGSAGLGGWDGGKVREGGWEGEGIGNFASMFSQDWMGEARCGSSGANQQGFSGSPGSIGEQGGGFDLTRQESQVSMISGGTGMVLRRQESQESSNRSVRSGGMGMGIMLASTGGMRGGSPGKAPSPFRQTRGPSGGELNTSLSKPKLPFQRQNSWAVAPLLPSAPVTVAGMLGIKPGTPSVQRVGSNSPPPMSRQSSALQSVGSMQRGDSVGSDFRMTRENSASFLPILSPIAPSSAPSASTSSPSPAPSGPASASTKMAAMMDSIRGVLQAPVPLKMGRPGDVFGTALSAKEGVGAGDSSKGAGSNKEAGSNKGAGSMKAPGSRKGGSIKVGTKSPNLSPEQAVKTPESDKAHEDGRVQFADGGGMGLGGLGGLGGIGGMGGGMRGNSPLSLSLAMTHLPSERRISVFKPAHESPTQGLVGDRGSIVGRGSAVWSAGTDEEGGGGGGGGMDIDHLVTFSRRGSTLSSLNAMLTTRRASETGKGGLGLGSWTGMMEEGEGESSEDGDNFRWGGEEDSEVSSEAENEALMDTYYDKEAGMQDTGLVVANLHADPLYAVLREEVEKEREWEAHRPRSHHQTKTPSRVGSGMGWVGQEGQGQGQEQTEGQVEGMQEQGQQGRRLITPPSLKLISSFTSLPPAVWVTCRVVYFLLMSYYECVVRVGSAAYRAYLMMEPLWAEMEKQHLRGLCMEQVELEFSWPLLQTLMAKYPVLTTKAFQVMELGLPSAETGTSVGFFNAFPPTKLIYLRDLIKHNMGLFQASQLAHVLPVAAALCAWSKRVIAKVYASCLRRLREVQSKSRTGAALHAVYHQPYRSCLEEGAEGEAKEEEEGPTLPPNLLFVLAVEDALDDTAITAMRVQMQLQMLDRETADGDTGGTGGTGGPGGPGSADAGASATATASASASALASVLTLSSTLALALGLVRPVDRLEVLLVPPPLIAVDMQLNALALEEQAVQANKQTRTHTLQLQMPSRAHTGEGGNGSGVLTPMQRVRSLWSQVLTVYEAHLREFAFSPLHRVMLLPPPLVVDAEKERTGRERGMGERWEEEKEKEKEKVVGGKYARHRSKSAFFTGFNIGDIDTGVDGGDGNGKIRHNSLDFVDSVGSGGGGGVEGGRLPLQIGLTVMLGEGQEQLLERLGPLFPASAFALQRHGLHPVLEHALSKRGEKEGKQRGGALTASVASISSPPQSPSRARSGSTDSLQGQSSKRLQSPKRLQSTKEGQGQGLKMAKGKGGLGTVQPDVLIVRMRGGAVPVPTLLSPAYSASPRIKSLSMRFSLVLVDEKAPPPQRPLSRPAHRPEGTHPQTLSQSQSLSRSSHTVQPAVALTSGPNKYLLCVEDSPGSWLAFQLVCRLARPSDTVALVHVPVLRHHVRGGGGWGGDGDTDEGCSYLTLEEYNLLAVHCTRRAEHLSSVYKSAGHNLYVGPVPSYAEEMQARQKGLERVNKMEALLAEGGGKGGGWGESIVAKVTHTEVMKPVQIVHNKRGSWSVGVTAVALSKFRASLTSAKNSRSMSMSSVGPGRLSQAEAMKAAAAAVLAIEAAETVAAVVEAATAAATAAAAAEALKAAQRRDRCTSFLASQQTHRLASQLLTLAQELRPTFLVIGANGKEITRLLTKPTGVDMDVVGMGLGSSLAESGSELGSDTQEAQAQYVQHCAQSVEVAGEVLRLYRECEGGEGGGSDNDGIRFSFILSNSSAVQAGD